MDSLGVPDAKRMKTGVEGGLDPTDMSAGIGMGMGQVASQPIGLQMDQTAVATDQLATTSVDAGAGGAIGAKDDDILRAVCKDWDMIKDNPEWHRRELESLLTRKAEEEANKAEAAKEKAEEIAQQAQQYQEAPLADAGFPAADGTSGIDMVGAVQPQIPGMGMQMADPAQAAASDAAAAAAQTATV